MLKKRTDSMAVCWEAKGLKVTDRVVFNDMKRIGALTALEEKWFLAFVHDDDHFKRHYDMFVVLFMIQLQYKLGEF